MSINDLERMALQRLLEGDHPVLEQLRRQLEQSKVHARERNEFGQFTDFWVDDSAAPIEMIERFAIDDVYGRVEGMTEETAFLLHVIRGRVKTLEAFTVGETWPEDARLAECWYVAPNAEDAGQLHRIDSRALDFALRGLTSERDED